MSKLANLQNALNSSSGRTAAAETPMLEAPDAKKQPEKRSGGGREGKENIAAWLPTGYKKSIRLVQAKRPGDPSLQELMAEAFNDLFIKYNVPTVSE